MGIPGLTKNMAMACRHVWFILNYYEAAHTSSLVLHPLLCSFSVGQEHISQLRIETRSDPIIKLYELTAAIRCQIHNIETFNVIWKKKKQLKRILSDRYGRYCFSSHQKEKRNGMFFLKFNVRYNDLECSELHYIWNLEVFQNKYFKM